MLSDTLPNDFTYASNIHYDRIDSEHWNVTFQWNKPRSAHSGFLPLDEVKVHCGGREFTVRKGSSQIVVCKLADELEVKGVACEAAMTGVSVPS